MSFEDFLKRKETQADNAQAVLENILNKHFTDAFIAEQTLYYQDKIETAKKLSDTEIYEKFSHNTDIFDFVMRFKDADQKDISKRITEKVETDFNFLKSAFVKKYKKRIVEESKSPVCSANTKETDNHLEVIATFLMSNDDRITMTVSARTRRTDKGRLHLA